MKRIKAICIVFLAIHLQNCSIKKEVTYISYAPVVYYDSTCYARGIVVKDQVVYTANSNGEIHLHDLTTKQNREYAGELKLEELRDVAINNNFIYGMQSGTTGKMIEIAPDKSIRLIEYNFWKGVFLDGMDFYKNTGFLMGDPVDGYFSLYRSKDGGKAWSPCEGKIPAQKGEAGYAASGTNVRVLNDSTFIFVSGGSINRFLRSSDSGKTWTDKVIPFNTGEGIGAFSVCFKNNLEGVAVGGDYQKPEIKDKSCFYTKDGGLTWTESTEGIRGFRSCVYFKNTIFYSCGTNGLDFSRNGGETWEKMADGNFFSMTSDDRFLYLTSPKSSFKKFNLIK